MFNRSGNSQYPCNVPVLRELEFNYSLLNLIFPAAYLTDFLGLRKFSSIPIWIIFIMNKG